VLAGHKDAVWSAAWSPDGSRVVTGSSDHTARIWDAKTGASLAVLESHTDSIEIAAWSPDGLRIVTASPDNTARIWDAKTGVSLVVLRRHMMPVNSAAWSPDGSRIVTASEDDTALIWDAKTGTPLHILIRPGRVKGWLARQFTDWNPDDAVRSVAWSPDGSRIIIVHKSQLAEIWDGEKSANLIGRKLSDGVVDSAAWSPDGAQIVTTSFDKTARIWEAKTGASLFVLEGHTDKVQSAAWSPDGSRILTASFDKTARIWDAKTGASLAVLEGYMDKVQSVAWSPDGSQIVTASYDNTARVWDAWRLLTTDTVTYGSVGAMRHLTAEERARVFLEAPKAAKPTQIASAAPAEDVARVSVEQLRTAASAGNPYAHRHLAELFERGEGVEQNLERALFHHAVEARLFEAAGNEDEAQIACARRGSGARALSPEAAVRAAYEAMDWRPAATP
jgi:WD40 repeat protein